MRTLKYLLVIGVLFITQNAFPDETNAPIEQITPIVWDFETGETRGWDVPDWAFEQKDHVAQSVVVSTDVSSPKGGHSLAVMCDFPGDTWTAAVIEYGNDLDLTGYKTISADIYLPSKARGDLYQARFILTVGPWWRVEQSQATFLKEGRWNKITMPLDSNTGWKVRIPARGIVENITQIRKIGIRIEYNANPRQGGPRYEGPVYVDNIIIE